MRTLQHEVKGDLFFVSQWQQEAERPQTATADGDQRGRRGPRTGSVTPNTVSKSCGLDCYQTPSFTNHTPPPPPHTPQNPGLLYRAKTGTSLSKRAIAQNVEVTSGATAITSPTLSISSAASTPPDGHVAFTFASCFRGANCDTTGYLFYVVKSNKKL